MTSGPVMNMWLVPSTISVKSVIAGEYTAPPAAGPMMRLICGITPEARVLRKKISAHSPSPATVVDADDRAAGLHRVVHHLDDLLAVDLAEAAAEDGEVLAEHGDRPAVHRAGAGDHAVAVGPVPRDPEVV